jgi:2-polyprenyl-3-methyl-5-hydroxy-6-metoxy-1,4-benzoquinol methylase
VLSPDAIRACYRVLLGREPEGEAVVQANARLPSYEVLLASFLESEEHLQRFPRGFRQCYVQPARQVDVEVPQEDLEAMFERIRREWSKLGEEAPYWSVLTDEAYRGQTLSPADAEIFFATGADAVRVLETFAGRCGVELPAGRCVEFGAGVGRVTGHLARRFQEVVAVDISPANLAICEAAMTEQGANNVTPLLLRSPAEVRSIPDYDVLFSTIVFQHNPPPVQVFLLDVLLSKLRPGGAFLFQTPTHMTGYRFDAQAYLASEPMVMEMHNVPMAEVIKLVGKHGAVLHEVLMDSWTGLYGSHTFFGAKPA